MRSSYPPPPPLPPPMASSPLFAHVEEEGGESDSDSDEHPARLALVVDVQAAELERTSAEADAAAARKKQRNVFVPVVCSIFGVVLFMRLGTLVGALGLPAAWLVVGAAFALALLTVGSLSALASAAFAELSSHDERLDLSGSFFSIIRRALGRRLGQLLGVLLFASFAVATAYYLLGFSEITVFYMGLAAPDAHTLPWNAQGSWVSLVLASTMLALLVFSYAVGLRASRRAVRFVFIVVLVAVACNALFVLVPNPDTRTGFSVAHVQDNVVARWPSRVVDAFVMFFPAFCGVLAGTNLAEDISAYFPYPVVLASPATMAAKQPRQLVVGVHKALFFTLAVYLALAGVLAMGVDSATLRDERLVVPIVVDSILGVPVVYLGVVFSTLSSALSNIMGGASIIKALLAGSEPPADWGAVTDATHLLGNSADGIARRRRAPSSSLFEQPSFSPPHVAALLMWLLIQVAILCGSVDAIIPFVTASFLLAFFVINFACFFREVASTRDFQPTFRMYSRWTALLGAALSIMAFALVVSSVSIAVIGVVVVAYTVYYRHELPSVVRSSISVARLQGSTQGRRSSSRRLLDSIPDSESSTFTPLVTLLSPVPTREVDTESEKRRFELAAQYTRDAIHGRFLGEEYLIEGLHKTHFKRMYHALRFVRLSNMGILVMLAFFETPSWCFFASSCGDPEKVLTWGLPVLPPLASIGIELACLTLIAVEMLLKYTYMGQRLYFKNRWHVMQLVCLVTEFASVLLVLLVPRNASPLKQQPGDGDSLTRKFQGLKPLVLAPLIRPLLLMSMSHKLRSGFSSLVKALPRFGDGLLTISVLIVIYAVCGMVLFEGTDEGAAYFSNFADACLNLLILLTTANYPDVMMPIYAQLRAGSLFFVSFLMVGQLLVMNLVFASVYQNYRQEVAQRALEYVEHRSQALQVAFQLLPETVSGEDECPATAFQEEKVVSRASYERLVAEIKRPAFSFFRDHDDVKLKAKRKSSARKKGFSGRTVGFAAQSTFASENDEITYEQFFSLVKAFAARQKSAQSKPRKLLRRRSTLAVVSWTQRAVASGWFEKAIDVLILGNLVAILMETQAKIAGEDGAFLTWERWMPLFSAAYLVEMFVKMYFYGFGRYFEQMRNVYDCVVTIIITVAETSVHIHYGDATDWTWVRLLLLLRFLRCLRLLIALKSLSSMFAIVLRLIPAFTTLYGMLGIVMAEYAVVGMQIFGGKLAVGDPRLAGIAYGTSNYYSNNFNDFGSSLVTLFELLIVNNWFVTMEGAEVVTSKWSRLYFVSFYFIGVVMVLSLVVAFVVEAYFEDAASSESSSATSSSSSTSSVGRGASTSSDSPPPPHAHEEQPQRLMRRKQSARMCPRADSIYVEDFL